VRLSQHRHTQCRADRRFWRYCPRGDQGSGAADRARLGGANVSGLFALVARHDIKLDALAFDQRAIAIHLNGRVMNEHVGSTIAGNESKALFIVKPLHGTNSHNCCLSLHGSPVAPRTEHQPRRKISNFGTEMVLKL
jgi:hypothetical protein